jgi:hypothetical protein
MSKIVVIIASVVLVLAGLMSFLKNIMSPPCDETSSSPQKSCVYVKKTNKDGGPILDSKYHKSYRQMHIIRLIQAVVMVIVGVLLFLKGRKSV